MGRWPAFDRSPTNGKAKVHSRRLEDWPVCLRDVYPAYITWDRYLKNRERVKNNHNGPDSPGVPRAGLALLPGVLVCGNCGPIICDDPCSLPTFGQVHVLPGTEA